ncbi:MAG: MFS transporter [Promethearchaeota archaeon]|nr:MAG: MFS transporter [Candidatus Lokiarchaeota archaeon]
MEKRDFTIQFILFGFFLKAFSRHVLLPNLIVISHAFFGEGRFEAIEMGLLMTALMGGSAIACLLFGILADKLSRKFTAMMSLTFWILGLILSAYAFEYLMLFLGLLFIGFGSGGYIPIAQAIIADGAPLDKKGHYYGLSSIFTLIGMLCGLFLASLLSPSWQLPYFIATALTIIMFVLYGVKGQNYQMGSNEKLIQDRNKNTKDFDYDYHLTWKNFKDLFQKRTNLLIFLEGIFSLLGMGIIIFSFYPFLIEGPAHLTPFTVSLIYILFIIPFQLLGIFFWGKLGDKFAKKNEKFRIWLIVISFTITTPYFMLVFWIQGTPAESTDSLTAALMNPGILTFIILFTFGAFLLGMYDPNQPPIINSVNLPETRGSVYAVNRFVEELGGAIGPLVLGIIFESFGYSFYTAISIGMLFFIPGTICWLVVLKTFNKDHQKIVQTVNERI